MSTKVYILLAYENDGTRIIITVTSNEEILDSLKLSYEKGAPSLEFVWLEKTLENDVDNIHVV